MLYSLVIYVIIDSYKWQKTRNPSQVLNKQIYKCVENLSQILEKQNYKYAGSLKIQVKFWRNENKHMKICKSETNLMYGQVIESD